MFTEFYLCYFIFFSLLEIVFEIIRKSGKIVLRFRAFSANIFAEIAKHDRRKYRRQPISDEEDDWNEHEEGERLKMIFLNSH